MLLLLVAVLFTKGIKGAHSWFKIGGFSLQPSELAKFATALALARYISSPGIKLHNNKVRMIAAGILAAPAMLITIQPDPGTVLVFVSFVFGLYREGMSGNVLLIGLFIALNALLAIFFRDSVIGFLGMELGGVMTIFVYMTIKSIVFIACPLPLG